MIFKKVVLGAICVLLASMLFSCEETEVTLGEGLVGEEPFSTNRITYDIFATNKRINAVQTNRLPLYQLGEYNDPIYGRRKATITSQIQLNTLSSSGLVLGNFSQQLEDNPALDSSNEPIQFNEEEEITKVTLYIPYQQPPAASNDSDNDGVPDDLDAEPDNAENDDDGDGISNAEETSQGTNPLDADTDGDNIPDDQDDDTVTTSFARRVALDSIFSSSFTNYAGAEYLNKEFILKVEESRYFLGNLDPASGFLEPATYYSDNTIGTVVGETLFEGTVTIDNLEILTKEEDDPETDVDESETVVSRLAPGIMVELNKDFFQSRIVDKEGAAELLNNDNFTSYIRGITLSANTVNPNDDLMLLLDLSEARINIEYTHLQKTTDDVDGSTEEEFERVDKTLVINLLRETNNVLFGNAINAFEDELYPSTIGAFDDNSNTEYIYLKGGSGSVGELRLFGEDAQSAAQQINTIRENNWIINEANIVFYVNRPLLDDAQSVFEPPRLYLYKSNDNLPVFNPSTEQNPTGPFLAQFLNFDGIIQRNTAGKGVKYRVRITEFLNDIIVRDSTNTPLILSLSSNLGINQTRVSKGNNGEIDLPIMNTINPLGTVLYGNNVNPNDEAFKLKLEIVYTQAN